MGIPLSFSTCGCGVSVDDTKKFLTKVWTTFGGEFEWRDKTILFAMSFNQNLCIDIWYYYLPWENFEMKTQYCNLTGKWQCSNKLWSLSWSQTNATCAENILSIIFRLSCIKMTLCRCKIIWWEKLEYQLSSDNLFCVEMPISILISSRLNENRCR